MEKQFIDLLKELEELNEHAESLRLENSLLKCKLNSAVKSLELFKSFTRRVKNGC